MGSRDPEACACCPDADAETKEAFFSLKLQGEDILTKRFYICLSCFMRIVLLLSGKTKPS